MSHIAYGSPRKQDTASAHGEPLGEEEIRLTKKNYDWPEEAKFLVPAEVRRHFDEGVGKRGRTLGEDWRSRFERYSKEHPKPASHLLMMRDRRLPEGWDKDLPSFATDSKGLASRSSSGLVLNAIAGNVPWLIGGSADLAPSTKTRLTLPDAGDFSAGRYSGRNFHFGVREHAMGAILNGLSVSGIRPYGSTFLVFSDYCRPAIRLSALMEVPVIYVFTHDSIGVGEDGPTHQPVEHLAALRAVPGLIVIRPADSNEVVEAWRIIMELRSEPVALVLSRQDLPTLDRSELGPANGAARGAYILADAYGGDPDVLLLSSGSEIALCLEAFAGLKREGIEARVISMPSWELFERQDREYRDHVIPPRVTSRVSVEMASTFGWDRYVGRAGSTIGMTTFGASAPAKDLKREFGFTPERIVAEAKRILGKK
jgi:transketolase